VLAPQAVIYTKNLMNSRLVGHIPKVIEFKGRTQNFHIVDSIVAKIRAVTGERATAPAAHDSDSKPQYQPSRRNTQWLTK
jgi:hypothetical protein